MSDTRLTMAGIGLVFAGFVAFGALGPGYAPHLAETAEFAECYEYSEDAPPAEADCGERTAGLALFLAGTAALIGAGIALLVAGVRGRWDRDLGAGDMAGPGGEDTVGGGRGPDAK